MQMLDRLVMNHRFKYRQQPMMTAEMRARSLPVSTTTTLSGPHLPDEVSERDDDMFDDEPMGRNIMVRTPSPPRQLGDIGGGKLSLRPRSPTPGSVKKDTPSIASSKQPSQSPILQSMRQHSIVTSMSSFSSLSTSAGGDSSSASPLPFLKSPQSGAHLTPSSSLSTSFECLPPSVFENMPDGCVQFAMTCPLDKVAQVIGKRGSILREMKRLSECEIIVDQPNHPTGPHNKPSSKHSSRTNASSQTHTASPPRTSKSAALSMANGEQNTETQIIRVIGTAENVPKAVSIITRVIELGPIVALGMETEIMECPLDKVPLVIGVKGLTAKEMMRRTGCKIHVNEDAPEGSTNCTIELTGTNDQIDQAKKIISHVLEFGTKALGKRFQRAKKDDGAEATA